MSEKKKISGRNSKKADRTLEDIPLGKFSKMQIIIPLKGNPNNVIIVRGSKVYAVGRNKSVMIKNGFITASEGGEKQIENNEHEPLYRGNEIRVMFFQKEKVKKEKHKINKDTC